LTFWILLLINFGAYHNVTGFFQIGVETVQKPAAGEPVNVQIIVAPNAPHSSQQSQHGTKGDEVDSGYDGGGGGRRGIFGLPIPSFDLARLSPTTINIKIPGKLPFNPLNIFNSEGIKNFIQSMTDRFMRNRNDQSYTTGFDDSVTIISEDPDKPVSENYGRSSKSRLLGNNGHTLSNSEPSPKQDRLGYAVTAPAPADDSRYRGSLSSLDHAKDVPMDLDEPSDTQLTEESMLDKQVATLNEVLTKEMHNEADKKPTSPSPPWVSFLPDFSALSSLFNWGEHSVRSLAVCNACKVAFGLLVSQARQGANLTSLMDLATFGCTFFRITSSEMCSGLVSSFGPIFHYMVMHKASLNGDVFCGISLQSSGCTTSDPEIHWKIDLNQYNSGGPFVPQYDNYGDTPQRRRSIDSLPKVAPKGIRTLKVLQLTDLHIDPNYHVGAMNECENELCCHVENGQGLPGRTAGYYGDYGKCDLPFHSYINALEHISNTHPDIKIIYLTGDFVPHNIWTTSPSSNMEILANASKYLQEYFPRAVVIPVIGNHETHPVNMFSPFGVPSEFSTDWLYSAASKAWTQWLPKESIHNFLHAGFYDVEIDPYFRVIVLNTNLCYGYNFWQAFEHRDPSGQLRWLARELQRSEDAGQFVHILGHMAPTESDCWTVWAQNFYEIVNRYKNIVKAQFYGHTHFDEFKLYYNIYNRSEAINPAWVGASLTPFTDLNPGYKIFTVDGARGKDSTWNVLEHETWIYNLTEANLHPHFPPRWYRLYKATEAFGIADLSPQSLHSFVQRMIYNATAFDTYYRLYHKDTDTALVQGCDTQCRKRVLCGIVTPNYDEYKSCIQLKPEGKGLLISPSIFSGDTTASLSLKRGAASVESPFQRMLSFGRSLLQALG
jgi:sphingomyelin phosphodiesterase